MRPAAPPQKARQSRRGISPSVRHREKRPTKPVLFRMFFCIHAETEPHTTKTRRRCSWKRLSHATLRCAGKSLSNPPIHEISSSNTTVFPVSRMAPSRAAKASGQLFGDIGGKPLWAARLRPNSASCLALFMPFSGASPSIFSSLAPDRLANSFIRVLLPMRRRPWHATRDGPRLRHSDARVSSSFSRPRNILLDGFALMYKILPQYVG